MENLYCDESGEVKEIHNESVIVIKQAEEKTANKTQEQTQQTLSKDEKWKKPDEKLFNGWFY